MTEPAPAAVTRIGARYHELRFSTDPLQATAHGVPGYDDRLPDPGREAEQRLAAQFDDLATELDAVDGSGLTGEDWLSHQILQRLLRYESDTARHGLRDVGVSASVAGVFPWVISTIPAAGVESEPAARAYLTRLAALGEFFDRLGARYSEASGAGRHPTALGVRQAIDQLDTYLATLLTEDPLLRQEPGASVDASRWHEQAEGTVRDSVRPAVLRLRDSLAALLPAGRGDGEVGVCHVPGGSEGYLAAARAHTTTELTPERIHELGLELVASLREEFAERGSRVLGTTDVPEVLRRLRDDPALRFSTGEEILRTVTDALRRAEQALPDWFDDYTIAPCIVREMDAVEAENSTLAYYTAPAADGSRPGMHVVNIREPQSRARFEYEALAFHESVPGHHLQIAVAQSLTGLPEFRRFAFLTAHGEGWGLYTERLCDEMGLYTDDLSRLGMVSFDAWRACRLVVDTGMHHYGWSRQQAIDYLRENTALTMVNIVNEVDRYIADPGQALGYMIGRIRIRELRDRCAASSAFDIKRFHHELLGHGTLPLSTLDTHLARVFPPPIAH